MGKFDNIIIATDLDGTFLGVNSRLVPENLEAIDYFKKNGGRFTFATGRVLKNMLRAVPEAKDICNAPIICCNGAYMYDAQAGKVINTRPADPELLRRAVILARDAYPAAGARVCTSYGYISDGRTDVIKRDLANFPDEESRILPPEEWYIDPGEEWYKIVFRGEPEVLISARALVEKTFGGVFEYANSSPVFFEVNKKGCTKAAAIDTLRNMFSDGTSRKIVYCCGDYENDASMLKAADFAVCPSNAHDSIKSISDFILCHHDKGIFAELIPIIERGCEDAGRNDFRGRL